MKLALVGSGYWGTNHLRALKALAAEGVIENPMLCDVDKAKAEKLAREHQVEFVSDYKDILARKDVEGVVIATPSPTHFEISTACLKAGKDVLVEKPMTMDVKEAKALIRTAEDAKRTLMVGHIFRHHPAVKELKARIDRRELGDVQYLYCERFAFGKPRKDMGVLYALGIHEVDLFCYLMNERRPKRMQATCGFYFQKEIEETALITMEFSGGAFAYAFESWLMPVYGKKRELIVVGSKMSAKIDYLKPQELELYNASVSLDKASGQFSLEDEGHFTVPLPYKEPLQEEIRNFVHCIKTRETPLSDMHSGLAAVEMIDELLKNAKKGRA